LDVIAFQSPQCCEVVVDRLLDSGEILWGSSAGMKMTGKFIVDW